MGAGVEGPLSGDLLLQAHRLHKCSPTHQPTSIWNLAAPYGDRRLRRKLTLVGVPPRRFLPYT